MDLSTVVLKDTCTVVIKHPVTKVDTDIEFTIYGTDSKKFTGIVHRLRNERLTTEVVRTSEQIQDDDFKAMHETIVDYVNLVDNGEKIDLTEFKDCKAAFVKFPFIYEQLVCERNKRANFL